MARNSNYQWNDVQPKFPWDLPLHHLGRCYHDPSQLYGLRTRDGLRRGHLLWWRIQQLLCYARLPEDGCRLLPDQLLPRLPGHHLELHWNGKYAFVPLQVGKPNE